MSVGLRLRPEAEADLQEAYAWYDGQRTGLGGEFLLEAERCLTLIQENPKLFAEMHRSVRHQARSPELWP